MKRFIISLGVSLIMLGSTSVAAQIYSTEGAGEDYGDIYSTRGNRDIYTTADDRQGLYTTKNSGTIYDSEDNREGSYTTNESPTAPKPDSNVEGAELNDNGGTAGSVYNGYLPE